MQHRCVAPVDCSGAGSKRCRIVELHLWVVTWQDRGVAGSDRSVAGSLRCVAASLRCTCGLFWGRIEALQEFCVACGSSRGRIETLQGQLEALQDRCVAPVDCSGTGSKRCRIVALHLSIVLGQDRSVAESLRCTCRSAVAAWTDCNVDPIVAWIRSVLYRSSNRIKQHDQAT